MNKKIFIIFSLFIIGIFSGMFILNALLYTPNIHIKEKPQYIYLENKTPLDSLVKILHPYLQNTSTFRWASKIKRFSGAKAGKYKLIDRMNNNNLINMLRIGKQEEVNVTFNNQNSLEDLAGTISKYLAPDSLSFLRSMKDSEFLRDKKFANETALLMYLPNTYRFYYNTSAEKFRNKMWEEYNKFWNKERREKARNIGLTPVEVGILASIIQQESTKKEELPRIAGVYLNRLKDNWLLQADPTLKYAYQKKKGNNLVIKRILNKHKEIESPYNTYKYKGLPPGPICMPDIPSIEAVLQPEKHNYYYFVADMKRPGYHLFSTNLKDHINKANSYHTLLNKLGIYK